MRCPLSKSILGLLLLVAFGGSPALTGAKAAAAIKRIPLTVENAGGVARKAWPLTQGVPFGEGEFLRGTPVRLVDAAGKVLPVQTSVLATWGKDMKFVKWLLLDFQADLQSEEQKQVFLEYGTGIKAEPPAQPVTVVRQNDRILLDTGVLRLELRTGTPDFLSACWVKSKDNWKDVFRGNPGPHLYLVSTKGEIFNSYGGAPVPTITIEEEGPLRASVAIKGYHATASGLNLCPYIVRIHACAGKNELRFSHTFVFDQNPDQLEFSEVGMNFPLNLGRNARMAFGGSEKAHFSKRWSQAEFLQRSDLEYEVKLDGKSFGKGEKTRGWASLGGDEASAFVAVRDLWQQFPKGYALTPGGIKIQFWPASYGKPLVYWTPWKERGVYFNGYYGDPPALAKNRDEAAVRHLLEKYPTAPLNLKSFGPSTVEDLLWIESMVDKYAPDRPASHNDTGTQDGTGAAKTHEFVMRFSDTPVEDERAEELAIQVQEHLIAPADPSYMWKTRAARDAFGGPDSRFTEVDALLDAIVEKVAIEPMHKARLWGFWRFGFMACSHAAGPGLAYMAHFKTDPVKALRHVGPYNNEDDDPCWSLWTQFLRSGKRSHFLVASGWSRAIGEVSICHAHPARPQAVGLMHYHGGHQWIAQYTPSHTINTAFFLHYYLTGDRRMKEIGLEVADWGVRNQELAGIITNRTGRLHRELTSPLLCVIEAYAATWEPKYGDLARRTLNWYLRTQSKPGVFPISVYTRGERGDEAVVEPTDAPLYGGGAILYPIFYEGIRYFDSPLLRQTIIAMADNVIANEGSDHVVPSACGPAYDLTGDPIYAAYCKYVVDTKYPDYARTFAEGNNIAFFSGIRNGHIALMKGIAARAMDKDPEGFAEAEKRLSNLIGKGPKKGAVLQNPPLEQNLGVPEGYDK